MGSDTDAAVNVPICRLTVVLVGKPPPVTVPSIPGCPDPGTTSAYGLDVLGTVDVGVDVEVEYVSALASESWLVSVYQLDDPTRIQLDPPGSFVIFNF